MSPSAPFGRARRSQRRKARLRACHLRHQTTATRGQPRFRPLPSAAPADHIEGGSARPRTQSNRPQRRVRRANPHRGVPAQFKARRRITPRRLGQPAAPEDSRLRLLHQRNTTGLGRGSAPPRQDRLDQGPPTPPISPPDSEPAPPGSLGDSPSPKRDSRSAGANTLRAPALAGRMVHTDTGRGGRGVGTAPGRNIARPKHSVSFS
jgi:hypothetical protein